MKMPFKTVPKIIYGKGSPSDLKGKEIVAHLMMRSDLAVEVDKYKFKINSELYLYLLYKKLTQMSKSEGWKWKKQAKEKQDKYDKLIAEYMPLLSKKVLIPKRDLLHWEYHKILRNLADNEANRREIVEEVMDANEIIESKKRDKFMKKYDVKPKQATLF
jgi:hypothetical protein